MKKYEQVVSWILQIFVAIILAKACFAKLSASSESVKLFNVLGTGETGMKLIGVIELGSALLLMINSLAHYGALLGFSVMLGALIAHITVLGFVINNDGGLHMIFLAFVLISCLAILTFRRRNLPLIGHTYE